jgi:hypothetical protein
MEKGIIVEGFQKAFEFFINDKAYKGRKELVAKDKVKIGNTLFEIVNFIPEKPGAPVASLKECYEKLLKKFPEQEKLVEEIENELSHLASLELAERESSN